MERTYDALVIGAGVTGCAIARELSRYSLDVAVIEKEWDVASGTSKANSGIVHGGFDGKENTLIAELNVDGVRMYPSLCKELSVDYKEIGSLVVATNDEERSILRKLLKRGLSNGVLGLEIISRERLMAMEPNITAEAKEALWSPYSGVVSPYQLTIALAENAASNGVQFFTGTQFKAVTKESDGLLSVKTSKGTFKTKALINAAGLHADEIGKALGDDIKVTPIKGQEAILDKRVGYLVSHVIFPVPTPISKGMLVSPTADGNLLIGPTAEEIEPKDDFRTTRDGLADIVAAAQHLVPRVSAANVITSYAGLRATPENGDFIIERSKYMPEVIHVAGIKSPGLTAAPAIAIKVSRLLSEILGDFGPNEAYNPVRHLAKPFREMNSEERRQAIASNPLYGHVVCRCEIVTEAEIMNAIHSPVPADSLDALKRRTRAGMGRCQSGFCGLKLAELLSRELDIPLEQVTKRGGETWLFSEPAKAKYLKESGQEGGSKA